MRALQGEFTLGQLRKTWENLKLEQTDISVSNLEQINTIFLKRMSDFHINLTCPSCSAEWGTLPFTSQDGEISCYSCNQVFIPSNYLKDTAINYLDQLIPEEMKQYDWSVSIRNIVSYIDNNLPQIFADLINAHVITSSNIEEEYKVQKMIDQESTGEDSSVSLPEDNGMRESLEALKSLLDSSEPASEEVLINYEEIAEQYGDIGDIKRSQTFLYKAERLARESNDYVSLCRLHTKIGQLFHIIGENNKALKFFFNSSQIMKREKIVDNYLNLINFKGLGDILYDKEKLIDSIKAYEKASEYAGELNDDESQAVISNNLGNAYSILLDKKAAMKSYTTSFEMFANLSDRINMGKSLNNIGLIIAEIGDLQKALEYFNRAKRYLLDVKDVKLQDAEEVIGMININTAMIYHILSQDHTLVKSLLEEAREIFNKYRNTAMKNRTMYNLAELLYTQHDYVTSLENVLEVIKFFESSGTSKSNYYFKTMMLYNRLLVLKREGKQIQENLKVLRSFTPSKLLQGDMILHEAELLRQDNKHDEAVKRYEEALKKSNTVQTRLKANLELGFYNLIDFKEFPNPDVLESAARRLRTVNNLSHKESIVLLEINGLILEAYIQMLGKQFVKAQQFIKQALILANEKNLENQVNRIIKEQERLRRWEGELASRSKDLISLCTALVNTCRDILIWY